MADRFQEIAANNKKGHTVEDVASMKHEFKRERIVAPSTDALLRRSHFRRTLNRLLAVSSISTASSANYQ